ncbi:Potassium-transporting ATPase ATP-binding subunit [Candidatus Entotheonellaceae bacterium PAL068K]
MFLIGALIAGGTLYAGGKAYTTLKKRRNLAALYAGDASNKTRRKRGSFVSEGRAKLRKIRQKTVGHFVEDERSQQIKAISSTEEENDIRQLEHEVNHKLVASTTAMGLAAAGAFVYPPLVLISATLTLYTSVDIFKAAYKAVFKERRFRAAILDTLAVTGALAARYYFVGALDSWLYFLGKKMLVKTQDHTRKNLTDILSQQPRFVWLLKDGAEVQIPLESLHLGDVIVVNAGESVPVDGCITEGIASIDQQLLTGEAMPAERSVGDRVFAATFILEGRICVQVESAGVETVAAQIDAILNRTMGFKSSLETKGQEIADRSVLPTLGVGALALSALGPMSAIAVVGANYSEVIRIVAPLGMLNFLNLASRNGILIKDGRALEMLNEVDTVVFDKTGTLTLEQPHVGNIYPLNNFSEDELLTFAAAAEYRQTHPIARAIRQTANEQNLMLPNIDEAKYEVGYGVKISVSNKVVRVGSARFMTLEGITLSDEIRMRQESAHEQGYLFVYIAIDDKLGGVIELHPTLRPEAERVIRQLKRRNLGIYIISGDHEQLTQKLAQELGIDHYFAEVLPEDKALLVEGLQQEGKTVCFVGDGMNDAIALQSADVSISLRGASAVATDTAQLILMDASLGQLDAVFELAQNFDANLKKSLVATFGPGLLCVGGVFFLHFRVLRTFMLYSLSLGAGVANAMLPRLRAAAQ